MRRSVLALCTVFFFVIDGNSQGECNNWIFGLYDNLVVFTDTGTVAINAPPNVSGDIEFFFCGGNGNACISDEDGNLLFYTDGETLWNGNYDTITNSQLTLYGNYLGTNLFIPRPGYSDRYFLLTTSFPGMLWGCLISEIDMNLNNGTGGFVPIYNYQLSADAVPKLAATYHANGKDIWVLTHHRYSNTFKAYLITEEGIYFGSGLQTNVIPVESNVGLSQQESSPMPDAFNRNAWGRIKISPGGNYIAMSSNGLNAVELFDFDIATGIVSNPRQITLERAYSPEFSPDGTILYVGQHYNCYNQGCNITYPGVTHIHQYDLLAGDSAAIINSNTSITNYNTGCWTNRGNFLQLGIDMKIYTTTPGCGPLNINVITNPNRLGDSCNWISNGIEKEIGYFGGGANQGLPPFFTPYLDKNILFENQCFGDTTLIHTLTNTAMDSIRWEFSDPILGAYSIANQDSVYHVFSQPGAYEISLKRYRNGNLDELKKMLYILPVVNIELSEDTILCEGQPITLAFDYPYTDFVWVNDFNSDSVFSDTAVINCQGNWWPEIINFDDYCGVLDTIAVTLHPDSLDLGDNVLGICNSSPVTLDATIDSAYYQWSTGDTTAAVLANSNGVYWVAAQQGTCTFYDTVVVAYDAPLSVNLPDTIPLCDSLPAIVNAGDFPADFLWSPNGETTAAISINAPGQYSVIASNACGDFTDSTVATYMLYPWFTLGNDTTICMGDELLLAPQLQAQGGLLWSTGETLAEILVSDSGLYHLSVSNACGTHKDSILIDTHENLFAFLLDSIGVDTLQSIILDAGTGYLSYYWSTFDTTQSISVSDPDYYWVEVIDSIGCYGTDTILVYGTNSISNTWLSNIKVYPNPVKDELVVEFRTTRGDKRSSSAPAISLWNSLGQKVTTNHAIQSRGNLQVIDTSVLPNGIYLLLIQQGNEKLVVKVVKE